VTAAFVGPIDENTRTIHALHRFVASPPDGDVDRRGCSCRAVLVDRRCQVVPDVCGVYGCSIDESSTAVRIFGRAGGRFTGYPLRVP
jgi:hypothetical protein